MSFLYVHEWSLFIFSEGLTWLAALMFFISRYWFKFKRISRWFLFSIILLTIFQGLLASIDYFITGSVSFFQVIIVLFIVYASTLGSSDFERLDMYIQQKFSKYRKSGDSNRTTIPANMYLKHRHLLFVLHTTAFIGMHFIWYVTNFNEFIFFYMNQWLQHPHQGLFHHPFINITSYIWSIIYIFDLYFYLTNAFICWMKQVRHTSY